MIPTAGTALLVLLLSAGGMSPGDSIDLIRLQALEADHSAHPDDIDDAVAYARVLHDLRRDKPALLVMEALPPESLDPGEKLFLASMRVFDSDLPGALSSAAPVCLPSFVILAAGSLPILLLAIRGRESRRDA